MSSSIWKPSGKRCASSGALLAVAVLLSGCGATDQSSGTATETQSAPATWSGSPPAAGDGTISVEGFNAYAEGLPESKQNPRSLAIEFLRLREPFEVTQDTSRAGGSKVFVLRDNLEDDSVHAQRYTLEFSLVSQGKLQLDAARVDYQCQPERGHQDFSPKLCL
jgi:hypothetical protein